MNDDYLATPTVCAHDIPVVCSTSGNSSSLVSMSPFQLSSLRKLLIVNKDIET